MKRAHRRYLAIPLVFVALSCSSSDGDGADSTASNDSAPSGSANDGTTRVDDDSTDGGTSSLSVSISEPAALDPALTQELEGGQVVRLLFETLVTLDPDLELAPGVATDWSVGDDGVTWTFNLDPSATFSDGRPVVADDFVFGFARAADPDLAAPSSYQGLPIAGWADVADGEPSGAIGDEPIRGVTAVDDHTLTIETEEPFALLPKVVTYPVFAPVAAEYVETDELAAAFAEQPIGNGPYMMTEPWSHNENVTVERNPNFAGTAGIADEIEFRIYSDASTSYKDFQAGNLDIARMLPPEVVAEARDAYPDTFVLTQTGSLAYIGFPTNVAPFDNPDIRAALSMAIDRDAIAERTWSGAQSPATGLVPPLVPGALTDPCDACVYDPDRAKELFDAAGGIPGNSMVVYDIADDGTEGLDPILNSWRELFDLDIEVKSFEFAQYLEETAAGKPVGPFELGWVWDYPSGYSILSPLFESNSGVNNFSWANDDFDAQMKAVREAADEAAGLPFLSDAQGIVESEMPMAPVTFYNDLGVHSDRLSNVFVDAGSLWRLELITKSD